MPHPIDGMEPTVPRSAWHRLRVTRLERPTADAVAVTLAVPAAAASAFAFRAGQHVTVRHRVDGQELRRTYSACPPPGEPTALRLVVKRLGPGGFADHAHRVLAEGDTLDVAPPAGSFRLTDRPGVHHVMVAGGSGVTPLLAMAAAALRDDPSCRVSLLHASRDARSALLSEELSDLKDGHVGRFCVLHVLSRETQAASLLRGRIDADRLRALLCLLEADPEQDDVHFYLCGPLGLVTTAREALLRWGAGPDRVRLELFAAADRASRPPPLVPASPSRRITVRLGGRTTTATTDPADRSLLDTVVRVRPEAPYSCRAGLCGTCRAKVVSGSAMTAPPRSGPGPEEPADGYVLTCRAVPRSATVELDFDI
ncbi:2Fe-2S iron-sulfur cluster-binding protein [Kitasatospora kifunensis]|uniref:Ring-1,2-phenylacetyl-CoA epoxidase subunit PaaE n=1 Tax=Kitasatospora kifunensis TaxID=58351 RepID=A0A7W7RA91_KITKI|nr:2Fe-2S iron-sulfur cluster-binding protein [Kitasatospora kifunensis]MBB4928224.1 ring-1,2-phenylacetyl-CoA epoxidase subunit PaaE [Kitasatospora kifunensis]